ncbi:MAG TPA: DUF937 domain-containing protein [Xanthobacteraceae bacterium]|jgi:hypothetical protein|nr:DUF937 domain-containing protein [Xanthobacteraceae bacterium]
MATNLVSYVMQFLTPDIVSRIATALGLNRNDAQSGVGAAVPALLAAFGGLADKSGGAQSLVNTIKQQSGVLDNFASMIGGNNQASFIERGSSLLTSLLGTHDQAALTGAVARFSGLGQNKANSLLGMLTPVVMGLIGRQIGARGVDVGSLTSLLASQKEEIAQALPAGMGQVLESSGLSAGIESVRGAAAQAGRAATGQFAQYAARPTGTANARGPRGSTSGAWNWAYWAIPLLVLGGLLQFLFGPAPHRQERLTQQAPAPEATAPGQNVVVGGVDVKNTLGDSIADMRASLQSITDVDSAKGALPKLEAAKNQIEKVSSLAGQLTPDQRKIVAAVVAPAMPTIDRLSDKVLEMPGVGDVLRPTIDPMKTKLAELAGRPSTVGAGSR